jgi:hypothetical protein
MEWSLDWFLICLYSSLVDIILHMNFIKRNWEKLILLTYALVLPVVSFAQTTGLGNPTTGLGNPISSSTTTCPDGSSAAGRICNPVPTITNVPGLINTILTGVLKVGIPVVALAIIYCGFLFVKARGNSEELSKAKEALLYTIIGAAILLGSWAIAQMISATVTGLSS